MSYNFNLEDDKNSLHYLYFLVAFCIVISVAFDKPLFFKYEKK